MSDFVFDTTEFEKGFSAFLKKWHKVDIEIAKPAVGNTFIHNVSTGLGVNPLAPPIFTGRLRGSGSAFVAGKAVADTTDKYSAGTPYKGSVQQNIQDVVIFYNTEYAARWHENPFNPGPISSMAGDTGTKFVESHLKTDGKEILKLYADLMDKEVRN